MVSSTIEEAAMRPKKSAAQDAGEAQRDLFRCGLDAILDPRHGLVRLAKAIDWTVFETGFGDL